MAIAVNQIHNLVRTYQRSLQPTAEITPAASASRQHDRVSVSAEAREQHEQNTAIPKHDRDNPKRSR